MRLRLEMPTYAPCINFYQTQSSFQSASPRSLLIHCAEANADAGDFFEAAAEPKERLKIREEGDT